jgi:hypothetical protein
MSCWKTPHNKDISIDGGPMWITAFAFGMWHNLRLGRATKEKWRILDEKDESVLFLCSELRRS